LGIEYADNSIRVKRFFRRLEIPYDSIKGIIFDFASSWTNSAPQYICTVRYSDRSGIDRKFKIASSSSDWAHKIYTHTLHTCERLGYEIAQEPGCEMESLGKRLEGFGAKCSFLQPNVDDCTISDKWGEQFRYSIDLGGYEIEKSGISVLRVRKNGWMEGEENASWLTGGMNGTGSGPRFRFEYEHDYEVRVDSVPIIRCIGRPKRRLLKGMVGYDWEGPPQSQKLSSDAQLEAMLVRAKAPVVQLVNNHIFVRDNKMPSEQLFRCIEQIAGYIKWAGKK
jgi:hypothetical protein